MVRKLLYHLIPFLLPFIAYGIYLFATRRARAKGQAFDEAPWFWLFASGLVLFAASLIVVRLFTGDPPHGRYVPPHLEEGQVVPGRVDR
ncbi:MAG: DUF6111 family protein [Alphaproteobacteria bacterium]|jgi:phosphoglycerol transferase MdoB-like AlkP superfamily enzyme|nr:DUF6111 family protein [Alphaproteobacteria bacterium]MDP6564559.1 DUF6111 family protein [Alphaproteobacteria bacterium]MDP6811917.1 DUF6111 family protein [Alphaproteobacteria bacterium]|tara:strand:- start:74 stop:340 length:267 start_codon:yes stop_codon:yes gene_type:complete